MRSLCALALLTACAGAHPAPESSGPHVMMWEARKDGTTTWLLGSIHMAHADLPMDAAIEAAFAASDVLVVEVEPKDPAEAQAAVMELAALPPDRNLSELLSPQTFAALTAALGRYGVPAEGVQRFRPWFAAMMLGLLDLQKAGFRPESGIDLRFLSRKEKPVIPLETIRGQLQLFDGMPPPLQEAMVEDAVLGSASAAEQLQAIEHAWSAGDAAAIDRLATGDLADHPELAPFYEKVLYDRNGSMAAKIAELHGDRKTHFVVVGASHLVGPRGIVALLEKRGFEVHQVAARGVATPGSNVAAR
jgi:uncharacterized protein YbaP (TraB family)